MNLNYRVVCDLIEKNSRVLDLGCGNGELLELLKKEKQVRGFGVEINQDSLLEALVKGLSVIQGDIDKGFKRNSSPLSISP